METYSIKNNLPIALGNILNIQCSKIGNEKYEIKNYNIEMLTLN